MRSLRVICTRTLRGRLSRRSYISVGDWLGWDHQFLWFGLRRLSRLRGFVRLSHWGLLRDNRDFRRWLCSLAFLTGVCRFFPRRTFSNWAGNGVGNGWSSSPNNAAPTDNVVPTRSKTLVRLMAPPALPSVRQEGWLHRLLTAFNSRPLSKRRLSLLPFYTAPVVSCVISSTAAVLKLLLWGGALPWEVNLTTSNALGCVIAVPLGMAAGCRFESLLLFCAPVLRGLPLVNRQSFWRGRVNGYR